MSKPNFSPVSRWQTNFTAWLPLPNLSPGPHLIFLLTNFAFHPFEMYCMLFFYVYISCFKLLLLEQSSAKIDTNICKTVDHRLFLKNTGGENESLLPQQCSFSPLKKDSLPQNKHLIIACLLNCSLLLPIATKLA